MTEEEATVQENKLGTMPIGPLLATMSLPIVVSMLVQALYNVVDSIFVARFSEDALAAVSLVFPIQNLMIAVGVGTAVGVNSLLSRRLGEQNFKAANTVAINGLFLALLSWLAFAVLGVLASDLFFSSYATQAESGAQIAEMGAQYMFIVTIASPGLFFSITLERLLQATGRSVLSMVSQMTGAVINIVLDPIMIFGLLGFPRLGVAGAALATVIGQISGMAVAIYLNLHLNKDLHIRIKGFRPSGRVIRQIYSVGLPSILMQSIGSILVFSLNKILITFGTTPVSVFGIYFKLQSFVFMPVFGFNNGMVPIVGYNYGAKRPERIKKTIKLSLLICFGIMLAGTLLFWLVPTQLLTLFDAQPYMIEVGTQALRVISLSFPMAAFTIIMIGFFQALGQAFYSFIISVVRQLVFLLPLAWLLARFSGLNAIWFAFPIAECVALTMALLFFRRVWHNKILPLYPHAPASGINS